MEYQKKIVSVIIPVFNAEKFILDCVNSIINQTYRNLEIIVVDDGSTDKTRSILEDIKDPRLLILNQENKGCSAAKNYGLSLSKGDFIQYLDADDYLSLDKIESQVDILCLNEGCTAVCRTVIVSSNDSLDGSEINTELISSGGNGQEFLLRLLGINGKSGMVQPNAYLITRDIANKVGVWNEDISPSPDEDGEYFSRVLLETNYVIFTDGVNYYRKLSQSNSLSNVLSIGRAVNLLRTVDLKFKNIFNYEYSSRLIALYQLNISNVVYQFGSQYPLVIVEAKNLLLQHGIKKFHIEQPLKFHILSRIIGFENALYLKRKLKKYNTP